MPPALSAACSMLRVVSTPKNERDVIVEIQLGNAIGHTLTDIIENEVFSP